jgi:hypothetical protein
MPDQTCLRVSGHTQRLSGSVVLSAVKKTPSDSDVMNLIEEHLRDTYLELADCGWKTVVITVQSCERREDEADPS